MWKCRHTEHDIYDNPAGEFKDRLKDPGKHVVVSVSQQSAASLAVAHGLSTGTAARKLSGLLRSLGVKAVFDIGAAREVSLRESANEFIVRYKRAHPEGTQSAQPCCSMPYLTSLMFHISHLSAKSSRRPIGAYLLGTHKCIR